MASIAPGQKKIQVTIKDASRLQVRVVPEPVFARNGRSAFKSPAVVTLQKIKSSVRNRSSGAAKWKSGG